MAKFRQSIVKEINIMGNNKLIWLNSIIL